MVVYVWLLLAVYLIGLIGVIVVICDKLIFVVIVLYLMLLVLYLFDTVSLGFVLSGCGCLLA